MLKWGLAGVCAMVIAFCAIYAARKNDKERAFRYFFPGAPASVEVIQYCHEQNVFRKGTRAITFKVAPGDLERIIAAQGFTTVDVDSDPAHWRTDLCNSVLRSLRVKNPVISAELRCFQKETKSYSSRVFYDTNQQFAILLGFGQFDN